MEQIGLPGSSRLASTFSERIKAETKNAPVLDFGSINSDWSLRTNTFPVNIPRGSYRICRQVNGAVLEVPENTPEAGKSQVFLPGVQPGDRVLVAWVGNTAVVVDAIG